jgi:signal transduction histidine kinase
MFRGRLPRPPAIGVDAAIVAALVIAAQFEVWVTGNGMHGSLVLNAIWLPATALPLLWRRRAPVATLVAVVAIVVVGQRGLYGWTLQAPIEPWLALLVAVYSVALYESGRRQTVALAGCGAFVFAFDLIASINGAQAGDTWPSWIFYGLAVILGRGLRRRQRLAAALEERTVELEHEREQKARVAVMEERARIARELHDVIAHTVSVIVVQASVERRSLGDERPETQRTLEEIERAGRESLVELRRLLGVLRHTDDVPALAPQPGLGALDALVKQVRAAGVGIDVHIEGDPVKLPAGLDLAAYRVIQEALTNTIKHAHAQRADVTVRYRQHELALDVVDDGRANGNSAAAVAGGGQGLVGMRERADLYGGELRAGRRASGGFAVHARFPLDGAAP